MRGLLLVFALLIVGCGSDPQPVTIATPVAATTPRAETPAPTVAPTPTPIETASACHLRGQLPDPVCTPGEINPIVAQGNIASTICVSGWTKTVRPPVTYTDRLKVEGIVAYGYTNTNPRDYEEDHLIPLELGGNPTDPRNLWPEPGASPNAKDRVENALHSLVCSGRVPLVQAQTVIATDWAEALAEVSA